MKRVVIIEDEPLIRNDIEKMVSRYEGFEVAGSCGSTAKADVLLQNLRPDVVLLDVQLGKRTAFDLLGALPAIDFEIIFITAHSQYAINAIKCGALDYLLKPISEPELKLALDKVSGYKNPSANQQAVAVAQRRFSAPGTALDDRIVLRTQEGLHIILFKEIIFCQSDGCYTTFYLSGNRKLVISKPLKVYDEQLPRQLFLRTHQSYIVNTQFIDRYHKDGHVLLRTGAVIPVSVRKKDAVVNFLTNRD